VAAARGQRSYANAQKRHQASYAAQERRHAENLLHIGDPSAWSLACLERAVRRNILKLAWAANPWRPGDAAGREKSVREYILASRKAVPAES